jgi:phthiodiolone/phenolphthiodiolone dimycocerosates ketoreductase
MTKRAIEIAIPILADRHLPATVFLDAARAYAASGVVDYMQGWDQLSSMFPPQLWNTGNAPLAAMVPDLDSYPDFVSMLSAASVVAPGLGTVLSTDAVRRGPAELMQTMLTVANLTQGRAQFHLGAGEVKQCDPFGWRRSEGFDKLEDVLRLTHLFWEHGDDPFDFDGKHWKLHDACLGGARNYRPQIWGLGGGSKLMDYATSYCDGFATLAPFVAYSPARWHQMVTEMKEALERKGRDPESFGFGLYSAYLTHEDEGLIEDKLTNPMVAWFTAVVGRVVMADWDADGIEPPMSRNWHYALHLKPHSITDDEVAEILARVTPAMSDRAWIRGTPARVSDQLQAFVDAGATLISAIDMMPPILDFEDGATAITRSFDIAARLKARNAAPTGTV